MKRTQATPVWQLTTPLGLGVSPRLSGCLIAMFLYCSPTCGDTVYAGWWADRKDRKRVQKEETQRRKKELEDERLRELEKRIRRRWREKQFSKIFDGLKGHLAKGRFKYLVIGGLGGSILTASAVWWWCHDGCRIFNPIPPPPPATHEALE